MFTSFNRSTWMLIPAALVASSTFTINANAAPSVSKTGGETLIQLDFEKATPGNYEDKKAIATGKGDALTVQLSEPENQAATVVELQGGNHVLQLTDNSTQANFPRLWQNLPDLSSDTQGNNELRISFDLTALPVKDQRPSFRILLNAGDLQTSDGRKTALQFGVSGRADTPAVHYQDGGRGCRGADLEPGVAYHFTVVVHLGGTTQDYYSLTVAPVDKPDQPVMDLNGIATRAPNVKPELIVFDGGDNGKSVNAQPFIQLDNIVVSSAPYDRPKAQPVPDNTLWQIGFEDYSQDEFDKPGLASYTIPNDWLKRDNWADFTRQIHRADKPQLDISFDLKQVPENGVELSFRTMRTSYTTPELAVYSNGQFAGQIQTRGTRFFNICKGDFRDVYRLYIPAQMLKVGRNVLSLQTPLQPYVTADTADWACLIGWDYLRLTRLTEPAAEPVHGRVVHAGTCFMMNNTQPLDQDLVRCIQPVSEWMGIAYSGNTMRCNFWINRTPQQPVRMDILQKYRDLNMSVVVDYISGAHAKPLKADGTLHDRDKEKLKEFFATFGNLIQFYEISNEPCLIGKESLAKEIALAKYINSIKPAHLKTAAPGYAFARSGGDPDGWASIPRYRLQLEQYCDVLGGHTYGTNFGAFMQLLDAYGPTVNNGWPKDFMVTEHGSVQSYHQDLPKVPFGSVQPHAAAFDRNMRNLIAVGDQFMYHAPYFQEEGANGDMNLFNRVEDWPTFDPMDSKVYPGVDGQENRVKTYRRLVLAYATHGQPLKYELANEKELAFKRVYVRPVNTAALAPLPGSGATSNKVLLNIVNFEPTQQTVKTRIYLPASGSWSGVRFGAGEVLREARTSVTLTAQPYVDISETLEARDSVQYILEPGTN